MLIVDFVLHGLEFLRSERACGRLSLLQEQMSGWAAAADLMVQAIE
ncbi:MAG: hypothetical protein MO846_01650 [Candidatus Devosia symbiotica]|nr:hypothetical protein [Candidatus Devosia symbiotica]